MSFVCAECGYWSVKWLGRCPGCGEWDSFAQEDKASAASSDGATWLGEELRPIHSIDLADLQRLASGSDELDRLLGGGLIPGGVVLFGGEPGIGKSTLLLQVAQSIAERHGSVIYVSGEESEGQVKLRAARLGIDSPRLYVLAEQALPRIAAAVERAAPCALIVDSIQTTIGSGGSGDAGSPRQLREVCAELTQMTKARGMATFLVGHITKEGAFAGPKMIEHLVDVALYLEGSRGEDVRLLRSVKNRFGATNEVAVYQMTSDGMKEVTNPSRFFLDDDAARSRPGSAIVPVLEGTRPILVELQALVSPTGGYGVPQRRCTGLDINRVLLLLAVIEKQLEVHVGGADVYLSIAGGLETRERASDLGAIAAVLSSLRNRALPSGTAVVGEVGLSGEVRAVRRLRERIRETKKMGFERILVPPSGAPTAKGSRIEVIPVETIGRALDALGLG